jgi:hypothetical protein
MSLAAAAAKQDSPSVSQRGFGSADSQADIATMKTKALSSASRLKAAVISTAAIAKLERASRTSARATQHDSARAMNNVQQHLPPQTLDGLNEFCERIRTVRCRRLGV